MSSTGKSTIKLPRLRTKDELLKVGRSIDSPSCVLLMMKTHERPSWKPRLPIAQVQLQLLCHLLLHTLVLLALADIS
jgi:hypothetical protein